jgi:hypothetical protein
MARVISIIIIMLSISFPGIWLIINLLTTQHF